MWFYSKYYKRTLVGKLKRAFAKTSAQVYNQIRKVIGYDSDLPSVN